MIYVDRRIGSGHLIDLLPPGVAKLDSLPFADCTFLGSGPGGKPIKVGIELKRLSDALGSMQSGRFAGHQLPGLTKNFDRIYVIIEGMYRPGPEGELQHLRGRGWKTAKWGNTRGWMYSALDNWLTTLSEIPHLTIKRTTSEKETAWVILNWYRWWTDKKYEQHRSSVGFDGSGMPNIMAPGIVRRIAAQFPGIGWEKSGAVAGKFKTVRDLVDADPSEWIEIDGIGKILANRVHELIEKGDKK